LIARRGYPTFGTHLKNLPMAIEINADNFEEVVMNTDQPVMVDFWAEWCGPCRMIGPVVDKIADAYKGKAVVGKVNVDTNQEISQKFGVRSIPTIVFIKNGEVVDKSVGVAPESVLIDKLDKLMG
jgi:thioredoxin 1